MKTRSLLFAVPITISMLAVAPLSAEAACWVWKPCAKGYEYGGGGPGMTESQSALAPYPSDLPPLPPDGSERESQRVLSPYPPDGSARPGGAAAATAPAGAPVKLTPSKKPAAPKAPAVAAARPAPAPTQAKAMSPPSSPPPPAQAKATQLPASPPAQAKAVPPPAKPQSTPAKEPPLSAPQPAQASPPSDMMSVPGIATIKVIPE